MLDPLIVLIKTMGPIAYFLFRESVKNDPALKYPIQKKLYQMRIQVRLKFLS